MSSRLTNRLINAVRTAAACLMVAASINCGASIIDVRTDTSWLATNTTPGGGWESSLGFDTTSWVSASLAGCPECIWYGGQFNSDMDAWMRKIFVITGPVISASLTGNDDDDAQVYINGALVVNDSNGFAGPYGTFDVTPYLVAGANLIAVHGHDIFGPNHHFTAELTGSAQDAGVPEPGSIALLGLGLAGLGFSHRKKA
jgi:hypothetical protein